MTDASTPAPMPPAGSSLWEDILEIFMAPSRVFARREGQGFWLPLLVLTVLATGLFLAFKPTMQPIFDAEFQRGAAAAMKANPQITPEMLATQQNITSKFLVLFVLIGLPITVLILGLLLWLVGKMVGAKQALATAIGVTTFSYFPRVLEQIVGGIQVLFLPVEKLTGRTAVNIGPARFLDPDQASSALLALLARADLFTIWITVLLVIGLRVTGKTSTTQAVIAGVILWFLGAIPTLLPALRAG